MERNNKSSPFWLTSPGVTLIHPKISMTSGPPAIPLQHFPIVLGPAHIARIGTHHFRKAPRFHGVSRNETPGHPLAGLRCDVAPAVQSW